MNPGNAAGYINMQCFSFPNPKKRLGNTGRNCLIGRGLVNFDMSLFKNVPIRKVSDALVSSSERRFLTFSMTPTLLRRRLRLQPSSPQPVKLFPSQAYSLRW